MKLSRLEKGKYGRLKVLLAEKKSPSVHFLLFPQAFLRRNKSRTGESKRKIR